MFGWSYLAGRGGVRGFYGRVMVMVNCFCCHPAFFSFFFALPIAIYHPSPSPPPLPPHKHIAGQREGGESPRTHPRSLALLFVRLTRGRVPEFRGAAGPGRPGYFGCCRYSAVKLFCCTFGRGGGGGGGGGVGGGGGGAGGGRPPPPPPPLPRLVVAVQHK
jgi:hypothetical protein